MTPEGGKLIKEECGPSRRPSSGVCLFSFLSPILKNKDLLRQQGPQPSFLPFPGHQGHTHGEPSSLFSRRLGLRYSATPARPPGSTTNSSPGSQSSPRTRCFGVGLDASPAEIKRAFRNLALQHHPGTLADTYVDRGATTARFPEFSRVFFFSSLVAVSASRCQSGVEKCALTPRNPSGHSLTPHRKPCQQSSSGNVRKSHIHWKKVGGT